MVQVRMLETMDDGEQREIGTVTLSDDGVLTHTLPESAWELVALSGVVVPGRGLVFPDADPDAFIRGLPEQYSGAYVRAELVRE